MGKQGKSKWCLIFDVPTCLIMVPFMAVGVIFTLMEIGYTFGRHHTCEWFARGYKKDGGAEEI